MHTNASPDVFKVRRIYSIMAQTNHCHCKIIFCYGDVVLRNKRKRMKLVFQIIVIINVVQYTTKRYFNLILYIIWKI